MDAIKLLLADDDQLLASLLDFRLKKAGYKVKVCTDGKSVKKYLETERPDIIVSDIMMPYFSGLEITDYVRNELKLSVPIIILSSAGNEENVLSAFKLGANDFLSKPVSPAELLLRLQKELARI
ncbi:MULTISPECIES: response regulator [Cellulophaga]|jgi:DNA-binding response OmpR family regulator|uniref:response regulator n=1 Tax=Cellulophaga TaxID=104264 RepID=UPI00051D83EA|nr:MULTISPECIES: response regulator [Cellulophaga]KGK31579.1 transcriptional regulator [Cellulophaga sp. E6(2014)]MBA6315619.1 response regulator [Cellulophaga baltica]MCR1024049.1 response regulator [Cellulophaga baltica]